MTWTEFIHISAHSDLETKEIVEAFYRLSFPTREKGLADISLLRNRNSAGDFSIRLTWHGKLPEPGKSALGHQLAEAFSGMGRTSHTLWMRETSLFLIR